MNSQAIVNRISIIVFVLFLAVSCQKTETPGSVVEIPVGNLELLESYSIDVPEPSGLSFGPGVKTLLTVSDHTNQVYEMDLQGNIIRIMDYTGKDLEGVTYNPDENLVVVAEEADREITFINYDSGNKLETYKIDISIGSDNSGLEGVSFNQNNKLYYIVNEMNPDLIVLWDPLSGIISKGNLGFADDYSGIFVDADHSILWYVSDQSKTLYKCDYNSNVLLTFNLDVRKYEGVAVDNDIVYLINDATAELNIYKIKSN